jgi:4-hydroxyproline epimerase
MGKRYSRLHVIDSHTGGEPTRVILSGGPVLGQGSMRDKLRELQNNHDHLRTAVICEPRGSDIVVGALVCEPQDPTCDVGVIFFNNVGYLGMCGHGTIGLMVTLGYLGKVGVGTHRIDSPVGAVEATLHPQDEVTVNNVPSFRSAANVRIRVNGFGDVHGDVAWGGNWFFLVNHPPVPVSYSKLEELSNFTIAVRETLAREGITGSDGREIDHVEVFGESQVPGVDAKNFVLCPGKAYDRSPCGTGVSAKLACLYADGKLCPGDIWRQESIVGSIFEGSVRVENGQIFPSIKGSAFITSEANLMLDSSDPFRHGLQP